MTEKETETVNLPEVLSASELQKFLHISRGSTYNLLNSKDFPTLHLNGRLLVTRTNLMKWMEQNTNPVAQTAQ